MDQSIDFLGVAGEQGSALVQRRGGDVKQVCVVTPLKAEKCEAAVEGVKVKAEFTTRCEFDTIFIV